MMEKHHNKDLEIEGLSYKKLYSKSEVNHIACMKLLLKYKADTNAELFNKRKRIRPIFQAVRCDFSVLKLLLDYTADKAKMLNQVNQFG